MKKTIYILFLSISCMTYAFFLQEKVSELQPPQLGKNIPAEVQSVALGPFKEIGAFFQFIEMTIFMGSPFPDGLSPDDFADELAHNFNLITTLHPTVKDFYYLCQSSIGHIPPLFSKIASDLLLRGSDYFPNDFLLKFYAAFNYFYYCDDNSTAAQILFKVVRENRNAPEWLGHLAGVLSAEGGDLTTAINTLQLMKKLTSDETERARYEIDINILKSAIHTQEAVNIFENKNGFFPRDLQQLVPDYIESLPDTKGLFVVVYIDNKVSLRRPTKEERQRQEQKPFIFL